MITYSRATRITTISKLTAGGGSAGGMPGMRLGFWFGLGRMVSPLLLLLWRRRREYDGQCRGCARHLRFADPMIVR
jgi:hypothetical protein